MKKLLLSGILLALTASVALAGTLNLTYGAGCWSDGTPLTAKTFACTSNTGNMQITGSFIPTVAKDDWAGMSAMPACWSASAASVAWMTATCLP